MRPDGWPYRRDLIQDGLAWEHQSDEGAAHWNGDLAHHINNPEAGGLCRVYGPWRAEDLRDFFLAALARVAQHGTSAEKATVRAKVKAKFPNIGKNGGKK